ncbi:MAG: hypothetical protein ACREFI_10915 [Stellaceae bacterium]
MFDPLRVATAALEFGIAQYGRRQSWTTTSIALVFGGVVCIAGGGGFAVAALTLYLIPILGAAGAALVVACALIALAAAALASSAHLSRRSHSGQRAQQPDLAALAAGAEGFIRENKALALSAAVVAGLLAGDERAKSSTEDWPRRNPS